MKIALIIFLSVLALFLGLMVYLLVEPIKVKIDTNCGSGSLGWNRWLSVNLTKNEDFKFTVRFPWWKKKFDLLDLVLESRVNSDSSKKKGGFKARFPIPIGKMWRAVKVKELEVDVDTDDFILNAQLVPLFTCLKVWTGYDLRINFFGKQELRFSGEAKLIDMLM